MKDTITLLVEMEFAGMSSHNIFVDTTYLPKTFQVDRITIYPDVVARDFLVTDIKVGMNSQLFSTGAIPALVFSESSKVRQPEIDFIRESQALVLSVTCQSSEARVFRAIVEGHQVLPSEDGPRPRRRLVLGWGSTQVPPRGRAIINVEPQCPFRPDRLMVPSDLAKYFRVDDFKVGRNYQATLFEGLTDASAENFSEVVDRGPVRMDRAQTGMYMSITVENDTDVSRTFQGAMAGEGLLGDEKLDVVGCWTPTERSLVATRLLATIQDDLSTGKYGRIGGPTVADVVQVLNAPSEVLDARREFFAGVMTGEDLSTPSAG